MLKIKQEFFITISRIIIIIISLGFLVPLILQRKVCAIRMPSMYLYRYQLTVTT